jgi:hypothetical protein
MKPNQLIIILLLFFPMVFSGQSRWMRMYFEGMDSWNRDFVIAYDQGYLLAGSTSSENPNYNWLLKTDLNGEVLWEKDFINPSELLGLYCLDQNAAGEIFLAGQAYGYGETGNPIVIKLNACGEKEWCRAIVTDVDYDYAVDIVALDNGGCTFSLRNSTFSYYIDEVCLMSLDPEGNFLWKECYNGTDTNLKVLDHWDLAGSADKGYVISGECRYYGPLPTDQRTLAYFVKTDSVGQQEWEVAVEKDTGNPNLGHGRSVTQSPDGQYYLGSFQRFHRDGDNGETPAYVKISSEGEIISIRDLADPSGFGDIFKSEFLDDFTLAVTGIWEIDGTDERNLALTNPDGVILKYVPDIGDSFESVVNLTNDRKVVLFSERSINDNDLPVLYKFNDQLVDDTLYLQPVKYDSLCPDQILSGTIYLDDCDIILDVDTALAQENSFAGNIMVEPNPCKDFINFVFKKEEKPCQIEIYSVYGKLVFRQNLFEHDDNLRINTSSVMPGLLFAVFHYPDGKIETVRIIKI